MATITYATGNLLKARTEALVNAVNCVGVMGRGIALEFKTAYPANFEAYRAACARGDVRPGAMLVVETGRLVRPRLIVNFPTKRHWRDPSRLGDIESGLEALVSAIERHRIRSIAVPPLGCGLGGLRWPAVEPLIVAALRDVRELDVVLYEPHTG